MLPLFSRSVVPGSPATAEQNSELGGEACSRGRAGPAGALLVVRSRRDGRLVWPRCDDGRAVDARRRRRGALRGRHRSGSSRGVGDAGARSGATTNADWSSISSSSRARARAGSSTRGWRSSVSHERGHGLAPRVPARRRMDLSRPHGVRSLARHDQGERSLPRPRGGSSSAPSCRSGGARRSALGSCLGMVRRGERGCGHRPPNSPGAGPSPSSSVASISCSARGRRAARGSIGTAADPHGHAAVVLLRSCATRPGERGLQASTPRSSACSIALHESLSCRERQRGPSARPARRPGSMSPHSARDRHADPESERRPCPSDSPSAASTSRQGVPAQQGRRVQNGLGPRGAVEHRSHRIRQRGPVATARVFVTHRAPELGHRASARSTLTRPQPQHGQRESRALRHTTTGVRNPDQLLSLPLREHDRQQRRAVGDRALYRSTAWRQQARPRANRALTRTRPELNVAVGAARCFTTRSDVHSALGYRALYRTHRPATWRRANRPLFQHTTGLFQYGRGLPRALLQNTLRLRATRQRRQGALANTTAC